MDPIRKLPPDAIGRDFVPPEFLPDGTDPYALRNEQSPPRGWRALRPGEVQELEQNGNRSADWAQVLVAGEFTPALVQRCDFYGLVRIGRLMPGCLQFHELTVPIGLANSRIVNCDIGDDPAIDHVRDLANTIVGHRVILRNVDEIHTTNHAKFGCGVVKDGEDEADRITLDLINENGGRAVAPFDGMIAADAALWTKFRDDRPLMRRLLDMTQRAGDPRRGGYGVIGDGCVIKSSRIIKDVRIGPAAYIKGANKLKNLTIHSSPEEPTQIGEGVELVNGIIGRGCRVFYGSKAVRFVMGDNCRLKYGARLIHSFLGDNSTVSCCEILNNLIFPGHEQHHNNSFLIASLVKGQSNIGAGATIGSNHNSRSPDGELHAGRGFWPGLCVSLKHPSRFASFALIAKGDYPAELNVPFPFSLVMTDAARNRLEIMPAYWWMHNMYALARNQWKFATRDQRLRKLQHIEFEALAPDTVEEIFAGMALLEQAAAKSALRAKGWPLRTPEEMACLGRELLLAANDSLKDIDVLADNVENSRRPVLIIKPREAYAAYRQMLHYYAIKNLAAYLAGRPDANRESMLKELLSASGRTKNWMNLGGQLIPQADVGKLRADVRDGTLPTWPDVHARYDALWARYPLEKQRHALATLLDLIGLRTLTAEAWAAALDEAVRIQEFVREQTLRTRQKDFDSPFRRMMYSTDAEMQAVLGTPQDAPFVQQVSRETEEFAKRVDEVRQRD